MDEITQSKLESIKIKICEHFLKAFGEESSTYEIIKERMANIQIVMMENEEFRKQYEEVYGKGAFVPAGVYSRTSGIVILHQTNLDSPRVMETVIHEIIHALSDNRKDKLGLYQYDHGLGRAFNEMATCYITSKVMGKGYGGSYSKDYREVFKIFLETSGMSDNELYQHFFGSEMWLTENMCNRFNRNNSESLRELVTLYDRRTTAEFDKIRVLEIIKESVKSNDLEESNSYNDFVASYCDYFDISIKNTDNDFITQLRKEVVQEPTYKQSSDKTESKQINEETRNINK